MMRAGAEFGAHPRAARTPQRAAGPIADLNSAGVTCVA